MGGVWLVSLTSDELYTSLSSSFTVKLNPSYAPVGAAFPFVFALQERTNNVNTTVNPPSSSPTVYSIQDLFLNTDPTDATFSVEYLGPANADGTTDSTFVTSTVEPADYDSRTFGIGETTHVYGVTGVNSDGESSTIEVRAFLTDGILGRVLGNSSLGTYYREKAEYHLQTTAAAQSYMTAHPGAVFQVELSAKKTDDANFDLGMTNARAYYSTSVAAKILTGSNKSLTGETFTDDYFYGAVVVDHASTSEANADNRIYMAQPKTIGGVNAEYGVGLYILGYPSAAEFIRNVPTSSEWWGLTYNKTYGITEVDMSTGAFWDVAYRFMLAATVEEARILNTNSFLNTVLVDGTPRLNDLSVPSLYGTLNFSTQNVAAFDQSQGAFTISDSIFPSVFGIRFAPEYDIILPGTENFTVPSVILSGEDSVIKYTIDGGVVTVDDIITLPYAVADLNTVKTVTATTTVGSVTKTASYYAAVCDIGPKPSLLDRTSVKGQAIITSIQVAMVYNLLLVIPTSNTGLLKYYDPSFFEQVTGTPTGIVRTTPTISQTIYRYGGGDTNDVLPVTGVLLSTDDSSQYETLLDMVYTKTDGVARAAVIEIMERAQTNATIPWTPEDSATISQEPAILTVPILEQI